MAVGAWRTSGTLCRGVHLRSWRRCDHRRCGRSAVVTTDVSVSFGVSVHNGRNAHQHRVCCSTHSFLQRHQDQTYQCAPSKKREADRRKGAVLILALSLAKMEATYHKANAATVAQVKECIQQSSPSFLDEGRVQGLLEAVLDNRGIHAPPQSAPTTDPPTTSVEPQYPVYTWGGRLSRMPREFEFPQGSLATAWQYWCVGDPVNKFPPFRQLTSRDMATKNNIKRLSDLRLMMTMVEECLRSHPVDYATITAEQAARLFQIAFPALPIASRAHGGDRDEQLEWVSLVRYAPRKRRRERRHPTRTPSISTSPNGYAFNTNIKIPW